MLRGMIHLTHLVRATSDEEHSHIYTSTVQLRNMSHASSRTARTWEGRPAGQTLACGGKRASPIHAHPVFPASPTPDHNKLSRRTRPGRIASPLPKARVGGITMATNGRQFPGVQSKFIKSARGKTVGNASQSALVAIFQKPPAGRSSILPVARLNVLLCEFLEIAV